MAATLNNEGRVSQLARLLSAAGANLRVKLVTAPATNLRSKVYADYTECTFSGYAQQTPTIGGPTINANLNAESPWTAMTFTHSGGGVANTVLGYIVVDTSTNLVWFSEYFSAPVVMSTAGNSITLTPKMYLGDLTPPY